MLSQTIAAFCIIDDALEALGYKDDPQAKTPASAILTLAVLAAMELGGKHNKALALAKDLRLFSHVPSPSRFNRRLHALYPLLLPLLHLLAQVWKNLHQAQAYALDTFPLPACENIRAPRSRLFPERVYRGFVPSKRVYFHGLKLHLLVDDRKFIHEVNLTPGSLHDLTSSLLLPLDLSEGAELYLDRGYESHLYEDLLREAQGVVPMVIRRGKGRRYVPWLQYLAIVGRRVVETVGGMLHAMFPRRIHAVTREGFVIKVRFGAPTPNEPLLCSGSQSEAPYSGNGLGGNLGYLRVLLDPDPWDVKKEGVPRSCQEFCVRVCVRGAYRS
uniref:transposase n=1 Tax=Thermus sediminis TaxID=1761908 RepID=UPI001E385599|nr:transposase [Thermus sediminis]